MPGVLSWIAWANISCRCRSSPDEDGHVRLRDPCALSRGGEERVNRRATRSSKVNAPDRRLAAYLPLALETRPGLASRFASDSRHAAAAWSYDGPTPSRSEDQHAIAKWPPASDGRGRCRLCSSAPASEVPAGERRRSKLLQIALGQRWGPGPPKRSEPGSFLDWPINWEIRWRGVFDSASPPREAVDLRRQAFGLPSFRSRRGTSITESLGNVSINHRGRRGSDLPRCQRTNSPNRLAKNT